MGNAEENIMDQLNMSRDSQYSVLISSDGEKEAGSIDRNSRTDSRFAFNGFHLLLMVKYVR
jgi:hypothetical protein